MSITDSRPARMILDNREAIYDEIAEKAVAGAVIHNPELAVNLSTKLGPEEFFTTPPRLVFQAVQDLVYEKSQTVKGHQIGRLSSGEIANRLRQMGSYGSREGQVSPGDLMDLVSSPESSPEHAEGYANILRTYSYRRKLYAILKTAEDRATDSTVNPQGETTRVLRQLQDVYNWYSNSSTARIFRSHTDSVANYIERLNSTAESRRMAKEQGTPEPRMLPYLGLSCMDGEFDARGAQTKPRIALLKRGSLSTILADTSVGKSLMAAQIAAHNALLGRKVLSFINELSIEDEEHRRMARFSGVDVRRIIEHSATGEVLSANELAAITRANALLAKWPGKVDYVQAATMHGQDIVRHAMSFDELERVATGRGYDLVIVDYIQKVAAMPGSHGRTEIVGNNVTAMSEMALVLDIPVLMTSQVGGTREAGADREEKIKPGVHSGKDSARIEEGSQLILGLWRSMKEEEQTNATIEVLKNSFGPTGKSFPLTFKKERFEFDG